MDKVIDIIYKHWRASESKCLLILNIYFNSKWWVMSDWFLANINLNSKHKDDMRNDTWHMRFKLKYKFLMTNGNRLPLWIKWPNVRYICHTTPTHPNKNSNQQFTSNYDTFLTTPSLSVHEMLVLYISEISQVSPTQRPEALAWFRSNEFLNLGRELHEHFNYALSIYRP